MPDEAAVRQALQDPVACQVLQACMAAASSAKDIHGATGVPPVTVYRHLKRLQADGLLRVERSAVTPTGKPFDLYRSEVDQAELTVSAAGIQAKWRARKMGDRLQGLWRQLEDRK